MRQFYSLTEFNSPSQVWTFLCYAQTLVRRPPLSLNIKELRYVKIQIMDIEINP